MRILCWLGFHKWYIKAREDHWHQKEEYMSEILHLACRRCGATKEEDDG